MKEIYERSINRTRRLDHQAVLNRILGEPDQFPLEHRCLTAVCFFSAFAFFISALSDYLIGLPIEMVLTCSLLGGLSFGCYYLSRYKYTFAIVYWCVLISNCLFLGVLWFYNGGVEGPSILIALIILSIVNLITINGQRIISLFIVCMSTTVLFLVEHFFPHVIRRYESQGVLLVDNYVAFIIALCIVSCVVNYAMRHFRTEKLNADQANKLLLKRQMQFETLVENAPDAIFVYRKDKFVYLNNKAKKLFGFKNIERVENYCILDYVHPIFRHTGEDWFRLVDAGVLVDQQKLLFLKNDGDTVEVELSAVSIEFDDRPANLVFARDMSERRGFENKLSRHNLLMQTILTNIPFGYMYVDAKNEEIKYDNRSARKILKKMGIGPEEKNIFLTTGACHSDGTPYQIEEYPVRQVIRTGEKILRKKAYYPIDGNNSLVTISSAYPIRNPNDQIVGVVNLFEDITSEYHEKQEHVRLNERMHHSQKMEAIGTLAGGIAHDFNNILSGMLAYSQMAKMHLENHTKTENNIDQVIKGIRRSSDLVRQILTFSRQTKIEKRPLEIGITIKEALKLLRSSLPSTITIKENVPLDIQVVADPTQIHQIAMNLGTNAYHAMQETGGNISVELSAVQIPENNRPNVKNRFPEDYARLMISDTGSGIEPSVLDKIFDPYYTTKEVGHGTGLGLSIVHGIVKDHGGFIEVDSAPGKGTRFDVFFPLIKKQSARDSQTDKTEKTITGTEHIMLVDDEPDVLNAGRELLGEYGYKVSCFENGIQAVLAFEAEPYRFDIVITDLTMPGMTGDKLCGKILSMRPDLPVILCTGYAESISERQAEALGILKYVQKPVDFQNLLGLIRTHLDDGANHVTSEKVSASNIV